MTLVTFRPARVAAVLAVLAALATLAAPASKAGAGAASPAPAHLAGPTAVRHVRPLDAAGTLAAGYRIGHHYGDAGCESGSPETGTTYECVTPRSAQASYDVCWVEAAPSHVDCLDRPWQHRVIRLRVTAGYDDTGGFSRVHRPWALRLRSGNRCLQIIAPVHSASAGRVDFACRHREVVAGALHRGWPVWRAHVYRVVHHGGVAAYRSLGLLPLAVAWFASPSRHA